MTSLDTIQIKLLAPGQSPPNAPSWPLFASVEINGKPLSGYLDLAELIESRDLDCTIELATCSCGVAGCADVFDELLIEQRDGHVLWAPGESSARRLGLEPREYLFDAQSYLAEVAALRSYVLEHCADETLGVMIREITFACTDEDDAPLTRAELEEALARTRSWLVSQSGQAVTD